MSHHKRPRRKPELAHRDNQLAFIVAVLRGWGARYKEAIAYVADEYSRLALKDGDRPVSGATVRRAFDALPLSKRTGRGRRPLGDHVMRLPPPGWEPPDEEK